MARAAAPSSPSICARANARSTARFSGSSNATGRAFPWRSRCQDFWLLQHKSDFEWLRDKARGGALDIAWVNHSYHHPYVRDRPDAKTFLLTPGVKMETEILDTERLLIANGVTPSVFFRFPGLIADTALQETMRRHHIIALGADSWLALGPLPRAGSILLVHPNGNEPTGLRIFTRLLERGQLVRPFRAIAEAP